MPLHARRIAELGLGLDAEPQLALGDRLATRAAAGASRFGFFDQVGHDRRLHCDPDCVATLIDFPGNVAAVSSASTHQQYPVIATRIDPRADDYRANEEANRAAVAKLVAALH